MLLTAKRGRRQIMVFLKFLYQIQLKHDVGSAYCKWDVKLASISILTVENMCFSTFDVETDGSLFGWENGAQLINCLVNNSRLLVGHE